LPVSRRCTRANGGPGCVAILRPKPALMRPHHAL
jgi:hypothetical protein